MGRRQAAIVADQAHLQHVLIELSRRGVHVLLSNSTAPSVARLYDGNAEARRAGLHAWQVPASRAVNSNAARRGTVAELVVSNIPPMPTAPPG